LCYIRCEECKQEVDLCAACFFAGMEPLGHKKTHSYRVMDKLDKPIFTEDWTAAEELSLVDQAKKMGLGAWEEISDSVRIDSPLPSRQLFLSIYVAN
ncbi:unnamed protein product, partial [Ectocarpus fasciculatus]